MEKRLDPELFYLRDCAPEHSTFPLDMEKVPAPKGKDVPINDIKVGVWQWLINETFHLIFLNKNIRIFLSKQQICIRIYVYPSSDTFMIKCWLMIGGRQSQEKIHTPCH